ncbi:MAG: CRISPR-associated endonuclease Cas3'' [Candidatus Nitrosocaldaceae archaeon]
MPNLNLYAKNTVTLCDHLLQTLKIAKKITSVDQNSKEDNLINATLVASALHDIGKADQTFQDYLFGKKKKANPHPLLALPIVDSIISEDLLSKYYKYLILLAIASHHTPLRSDLYENKHNICLNVTNINELKLILEVIKNASCINLDIDKLNLSTRPIAILKQALYELLNNDDIDKNKLREDFVYIQGVLEQADWLASASKDLERVSFPQSFINSNYDYQDKASNT